MPERYRFRWWLVDEYGWARLALPCAVILLASLPLFLNADNRRLILLYTLLPVYMLHQYEEHAHGRFVAFVNATIGQGRAVLTPVSAFWINLLEVWLLFLVAFYLARYVEIGLAFVPVYLTLINALTHTVASVVLRRYNPGLVTSLLLLLPWGGFVLVFFADRVERAPFFNAVGIAAGIVGHVVLVAYILKRRKELTAAVGADLGTPRPPPPPSGAPGSP